DPVALAAGVATPHRDLTIPHDVERLPQRVLLDDEVAPPGGLDARELGQPLRLLETQRGEEGRFLDELDAVHGPEEVERGFGLRTMWPRRRVSTRVRSPRRCVSSRPNEAKRGVFWTSSTPPTAPKRSREASSCGIRAPGRDPGLRPSRGRRRHAVCTRPPC